MKMIKTNWLRYVMICLLFENVPWVIAVQHSGIRGEASIAASCFQGQPSGILCMPEFPVQTRAKVYSDKGKLVMDFTTDAQGHFEVWLKPGSYVLMPYFSGQFSGPLRGAIPLSTTVTVNKKELTSTHLTYLYPWVR